MMFKKVFDAFPPPEFLDIPYAGVSISDTFVRCIQFGKKGNSLYVEKYAERALSPGVVEGGFIHNMQEVTNIFKSLKKDLKLGYIKVALPEEKAYLFTSQIPLVATKEIRNTIEFKIEENVPLPASKIIFDYAVVNPENHADHLDIVVSALPTKVVDVYVETVHNADVSLLALEIESQAIARALLPTESKGTYLIVHFGPGKVGLYIVNDRIVHFTSTVPTDNTSTGDLQFLPQEIEKLYKYWSALKENIDQPDKVISKVIVCGEGFDGEIVSHISSHNKVPVELGNVWINAFDINTSIPPISFDDSLKYAAAIGLALPTDILL